MDLHHPGKRRSRRTNYVAKKFLRGKKGHKTNFMALYFMAINRFIGPFLFLSLSALVALYFWEPLTQSVLFIERDLPVFFFPPLKLWTEALKAGELPLWNPYIFCGQPLFASLQTAILYPPNLLLLLLPIDFAFNLTIILHFLLAGWFIYLLTRELGGSRMAGVLAAVSFSFGGFLLSVHNVLSTLQSIIWVPLIFFFILRAVKKRSWSYGLLTAFSVLIQFLGGGIEIFLLTQAAVVGIGLFPRMLVKEMEIAPWQWRLQIFSIIYLLFLGLGAVQIFPFLEMVRLSIRNIGFSFYEATRWSLNWKELIYIFLPDFFWRGAKFYYEDQNWLKSIYLGIIPLVLVFFYFTGKDRRRIWFGLLLLIPLLMALGRNTPLYKILFAYIPGLNKIHYPVKFYFLTNLFLCILTGLGWDALSQRFRDQPHKKMIFLKKISLILALICVFFLLGLSLFQDFFIGTLKTFIVLGHDRPWELNLHNLSRVIFFSLLTFLFFSFLADRKLSFGWGRLCVTVLLLADLFLGNWGQYKYVDRKEFYKPGPNLQIALSDPSLFRVYTDIKVLKSVSFADKEKSITNLFFQERFNLDYTMIHRIYNSSGFPVLVYKPYKDLLNLLETSPYPQATDLLRIMNVKYLLWHEPLNDPSFKLLRKGDLHLSPQEESKPIPDRPPPYKPIVPLLYENQKVLPRAYLASGFRVVHNEKEMRDLITTKGFDPVQTVLLEEVPVSPRPSKGSLPDGDSLRILKYSLNQIQLTASCMASRLLFLSETYYPGWKVWIDGKREKIYRANHAFRAVALGPGHHTITFSYQPFSFYLGLLISSLTFLGLLVFLIFFRKKSLRKINQEELPCPPVT